MRIQCQITTIVFVIWHCILKAKHVIWHCILKTRYSVKSQYMPAIQWQVATNRPKYSAKSHFRRSNTVSNHRGLFLKLANLSTIVGLVKVKAQACGETWSGQRKAPIGWHRLVPDQDNVISSTRNKSWRATDRVNNLRGLKSCLNNPCVVPGHPYISRKQIALASRCTRGLRRHQEAFCEQAPEQAILKKNEVAIGCEIDCGQRPHDDRSDNRGWATNPTRNCSPKGRSRAPDVFRTGLLRSRDATERSFRVQLHCNFDWNRVWACTWQDQNRSTRRMSHFCCSSTLDL